MVSSVTPWMCCKRLEYQFASCTKCALIAANNTVSSSLPGLAQHRNTFFGFAAQNQQQSRASPPSSKIMLASEPFWPVEDFVSIPSSLPSFRLCMRTQECLLRNRCGSGSWVEKILQEPHIISSIAYSFVYIPNNHS